MRNFFTRVCDWCNGDFDDNTDFTSEASWRPGDINQAIAAEINNQDDSTVTVGSIPTEPIVIQPSGSGLSRNTSFPIGPVTPQLSGSDQGRTIFVPTGIVTQQPTGSGQGRNNGSGPIEAIEMQPSCSGLFRHGLAPTGPIPNSSGCVPYRNSAIPVGAVVNMQPSGSGSGPCRHGLAPIGKFGTMPAGSGQPRNNPITIGVVGMQLSGRAQCGNSITPIGIAAPKPVAEGGPDDNGEEKTSSGKMLETLKVDRYTDVSEAIFKSSS